MADAAERDGVPCPRLFRRRGWQPGGARAARSLHAVPASDNGCDVARSCRTAVGLAVDQRVDYPEHTAVEQACTGCFAGYRTPIECDSAWRWCTQPHGRNRRGHGAWRQVVTAVGYRRRPPHRGGDRSCGRAPGEGLTGDGGRRCRERGTGNRGSKRSHCSRYPVPILLTLPTSPIPLPYNECPSSANLAAASDCARSRFPITGVAWSRLACPSSRV